VKRTVLAAAVAVGLASASPARAQFVLGSVHPGPHRGGFSDGWHGPHGLRVAGFAGGYYSRFVFVAPPVLPVLPPVAMLTPFGWTPGFIGPGWGAGPGGAYPGLWGAGWGWSGPPVIVVPPPIVLAGNNAADPNANANANPALAFEQLPRPIDPLPRGAKPGDFLVISPRKDFPPPGQISPDIPRVAAPMPAPVPRPMFNFDPFANRKLVNVDRPDPDPVKEAARLVKLGRAAFESGEYGKAAEQFDRAAGADPKAALPHFLKAQAAFAAGRYADAVTAIRAGLALDPAWPAAAFDPKAPYGANPAAFTEHLAELRRAVAANPGEAALEFLLGYQLWFTGEKAEARKLFDAAEKRLPAPGPIALFK
jgi:hypothetical protein